METNSSLQKTFVASNFEITLFPEKTRLPFKSFQSFKEYIDKEIAFWSDCTVGETRHIRNHFATIQGNLSNLTKNPNNDEQGIRNILDITKQHCNLNAFPCVYSATVFGKFIKGCYLRDPLQADAARDYLFPKSRNNRIDLSNTNIEYVKGLIHAFIVADTDIVTENETKNQRDSLADLRERYSQNINELQTDYFNRKETIDTEHKVYKESLETWKNKIWEEIDTFYKQSVSDISALKKTYEELLRLDGPAKYWNDMAEEYKDKGDAWRNYSLILCVGFIIYLTLLLYNLPEAWKLGKWFDLGSVKSTIIFALIIGIGAFLLQLFTKLSISAYHLARDAKERLQLTHVYLSLLNEKAVTEGERNIVMQAIFSRADTGLLKGDSSPTLPDGLISQCLKHFGKSN